MGMFMSAYELLSDIELDEEAIKCLALSNRPTDAIKRANDCLQRFEKEGKTETLSYANLLCTLGDVKRDISLYTKAWEVSKNRCARAMRSLARQHYFRQEFEESIACF